MASPEGAAVRGSTRRASYLAAGLFLAGCSASSPSPSVDGVLVGKPASDATACSSLKGVSQAIKAIWGSPISGTSERNSPRSVQTRQTGCIVDVKGEDVTTLAVYLWHGKDFDKQWGDEINFDETAGLSSEPYGRESYAKVVGTQTVLAVKERNFAVRLLCGPKPSAPTRPIGLKACARLVTALDDHYRH